MWTGAYAVEGAIWPIFGLFATLRTAEFDYRRRLVSTVGVKRGSNAYRRNETPTVVARLPVQEAPLPVQQAEKHPRAARNQPALPKLLQKWHYTGGSDFPRRRNTPTVPTIWYQPWPVVSWTC